MAISFNRTRTQLAQRILNKVLHIGMTTTMVSADADLVYEAIDLRLKEFHKLGTVWRNVTTVPVTFSLSAGSLSASAGAGDILFPLSMTFTNGTNDDPIEIIGAEDYAAIPDKTRTGNPEKALWKGGTEFIFYPIYQSNGTAKILYEKIADDTSAGGVVDVGVSMLRCLIDLVKYDIADDYGVQEPIVTRWRNEALLAERDIRKLGVQHVTLSTVQVDDYDTPHSRSKSDWHTG